MNVYLLPHQRRLLINHAHYHLGGRGRSRTCTNTALMPKYGGQAHLLASWQGIHKNLYILLYNIALWLFCKLSQFRRYSLNCDFLAIRPTTKAYLTAVLSNFSKMPKDRILQVGTNKLQKALNEASGTSLFSVRTTLLGSLYFVQGWVWQGHVIKQVADRADS